MLLREPMAVLSVLLIILFGKSIVAFFIVLELGYPTPQAFAGAGTNRTAVRMPRTALRIPYYR